MFFTGGRFGTGMIQSLGRISERSVPAITLYPDRPCFSA